MRSHTVDEPDYYSDHQLPYEYREAGPARLGVGPGMAVALAAGALLLGANVLAGRRRDRQIGRIAEHPDDAPAHARRTHPDDLARVARSVTINRPRHELYEFWRNFDNLPKFMSNVEKVEKPDGNRSAWTLSAPGFSARLDSEIVEDRPDELIAWRSLPDSAIRADGRITFHDAPGGRGTIVEARIVYEPPAGEVGRWIAKLFRREPEIQGRHELKRFKMLMETGEIATSDNRVQS